MSLPESLYRKAFARIAMQTPNAIASIGIVTIPNISARGSDATHSVKGLGRGSSGFAAMGRSPIRSPQFLNVDLVLLFFATVRRVITACPPAASRRLSGQRQATESIGRD